MKIKDAVEITAKTIGIELNTLELDQANQTTLLGMLQALTNIQTDILRQNEIHSNLKRQKQHEELTKLG